MQQMIPCPVSGVTSLRMSIWESCRQFLFPLLVLTLSCGDQSSTELAPQTPAQLSVLPPAATLAAVGETVQLTATVVDQNGQTMRGVALNWASSDASVATVDAAGVVTAVWNGSASIAVAVAGGGPSASVAVTVVQQVAEIGLSPTPRVFRALADTLRLSAEGLDANGNLVADADFDWSSTDASVVIVDGTGLVTAVSNGTASIRVTSPPTTASWEAVVEQEASEIVVSPSAHTFWLPGEDSLRLSARATDSNNNAMPGTEFTWSSSDESVATVTNRGLVTAIDEGSAEITATSGSAVASATIAVKKIPPEKDVLVALYNATDGPHWYNNSGWLEDNEIGAWHGVETNDSGRVTAIGLVRNNLTGVIPPDLGRLTNLESLSLRDNDLSGSIPAELGDLAELDSLDLSYNQLTGELPPELANAGRLRWLAIGINKLTGQIPREFGSLSRLERLWLNFNRLSGPVPAEVGNLGTQFELFDVRHNRDLSGPLPLELTKLTGLRRFEWDNTGLCSPDDPTFLAWLRGIDQRYGGRPVCQAAAGGG